MHLIWAIIVVLVWMSLSITVRDAFSATSKSCNFQRIGDGVCVCNATYCDTLNVPNAKCGEFVLITTSKMGKRFHISDPMMNSSKVAVPTNRWLKIDTNQTYQNVMGFGGGFTDAVSAIIASMTESLRYCVYMSYASVTNGAAYQLFRIPLGGSDFSETPWAYNEQPEYDVMLTNMTEFHPLDQRRVEQIKELATFMPNSTMKLMLCAWSPPPWMKNNKRWTGISHLPMQFYSVWALYHIKALDLYRHEGINVWSLSTGNEPISSSIVPFMGLGWSANNQKQWVSMFLKPMLKGYGYGDVLIIGLDDQRTSLSAYGFAFQRNFTDPQIVDLDMIGVHWYLDSVSDINTLDRITKRHRIPILYTESCVGAGLNGLDTVRGPKLGSWARCQEYVQNMIKVFSHGVSGFIDWNMVLNLQGGPNYIHNYADAPLIFDQQNQTFYKQPMFYGIAHFSRFLHANCTRIGSQLSLISGFNVDAIAFSCIDYTRIIIMHNRSSNDERITVIVPNIVSVNLILDASSVNTLVYRDC